jgi:hypothetical protein
MKREAAWARWVQALNAYGDLSITRRAVHEAVRLERCGVGGERGQVVQGIEGLEAVNAWLALTRDVCTFTLGPVDEDGARYAITAGDFTGGGQWTATWADDGRLATLRHEPDDLTGDPDEAVAAAHAHD